jgi:hypothetical protein
MKTNSYLFINFNNYQKVEKGVWHAKCKYINETPKSEYSPKYLFINFNLYTRVKV